MTLNVFYRHFYDTHAFMRFFGGDIIPAHKQLSVRMTDIDIDNLHKLANENNVSVAEQARRYIMKGMTIGAYQKDEEIILSHMKTALKSVLDPQIERIAKISIKNSIASSINLLYTAFLMLQTAKPESRVRLEPIMNEARRLGISFVQLAKGSVDDFVKTSVDKLNAMWNDV